MGTVYRAHDRLTSEIVALKQVSTAVWQPHIPEMALMLAQEFQALASLRHPHIIAVRDYGFADVRPQVASHPFFTMELLRQAHNLVDAAEMLPLPDRIHLLLQLLSALTYVHRRGIIHRDLKPGNVLVTGQTVKVLDFGLAAMAGQEALLSGTLPYIAPELMFGQPPSIASDLYAVGVIAYEMLVGWHPFPQSSSMVPTILYEGADFSYVTLERPLTAVLRCLLSRDPTQRYPDATTTIAALCEAMGWSLPAETAVTRDSFLQAAPFIGRQQELDQLMSLFAPNPATSPLAWLLSGESGIGKTRLLQELRTRALIQGVWVLRGQCQNGGGAYHLWQDILPPLLLMPGSQIELSELEAAVLYPLIPNLETVLGYTIPPAPPLDPPAAQTRLRLTVADVLRRAGQRQPILLLLEDLHLIDTHSLELLARIIPQIAGNEIRLVASYRPEERPSLPAELPPVKQLSLFRFSYSQVADLCAAVLGENGRQPHLVEFVHRETEGNTFFIVEVLRTLAEEAGRLAQVASMPLPLTIFAGGMQQMVQRRLQHVPALYQPLLQTAAIAGRQIDLTLLAHLYPNLDLQEWLTICANTAVLERPVGDRHWQFSHDKLRDGLLAQLSDSAAIALHQTVAAGLETVYAADLSSHYAALAFHFGRAAVTVRQKQYLQLAAQQAEQAYAHETAVTHLCTLLPLLTSVAETAVIQLQLGRLYKLIGRWDEARRCLEMARQQAETAVDHPTQAQALYALGNLARSQGQYSQALAWLEQARAYYHNLMPQHLPWVGRSLCAVLVEISNTHYQQGNYAAARLPLSLSLEIAQAADDPKSIALTEHSLGSIAYSQNEYETARTHFAAALTTRQNLPNKSELADSYNNLGLVAFRQGDFVTAQDYFGQSLALRRAAGDRWAIAASLNNLGLIPYQQGDYEAARGYWQEVLHIRRALGDDWGTAGVLDNLALIAMSQADAAQLARAVQLMAEGVALRRRLGDRQGLAISLGNRGRLSLRLGEVATAVTCYRESLQLAAEIGDQLGMIFALTGIAAAWTTATEIAATTAASAQEAVQLLAAASANMQQLGGYWERDEQALYDAALAQAQTHLPPDEFAAAWARGSTLPLSAAQQLVGIHV